MPASHTLNRNGVLYDVLAVSEKNSFLESILIAAGHLGIKERIGPEFLPKFPVDKMALWTQLKEGQQKMRDCISQYLTRQKHAVDVNHNSSKILSALLKVNESGAFSVALEDLMYDVVTFFTTMCLLEMCIRQLFYCNYLLQKQELAKEYARIYGAELLLIAAEGSSDVLVLSSTNWVILVTRDEKWQPVLPKSNFEEQTQQREHDNKDVVEEKILSKDDVKFSRADTVVLPSSHCSSMNTANVIANVHVEVFLHI